MNEKCIDCKAPATQLAPFPLCSKHWTDRYAKGPLRGEDGELLPYKKSLIDILKGSKTIQPVKLPFIVLIKNNSIILSKIMNHSLMKITQKIICSIKLLTSIQDYPINPMKTYLDPNVLPKKRTNYMMVLVKMDSILDLNLKLN